jgi:hypothetical protein
MKKTIYIITAIAALFSSCNGQNQKNKKDEKITSSIHQDEPGKPKADIKVNKYYDKNGNLVAFDSTYTSYYSSRKGDKKLVDSLFKEFKPAFNEQFSFMNDPHFKSLFYNDSLLYNDFFHDNFFEKRFELNKNYMSDMMHQMDSVKNEFFKMQGKAMKKK